MLVFRYSATGEGMSGEGGGPILSAIRMHVGDARRFPEHAERVAA